MSSARLEVRRRTRASWTCSQTYDKSFDVRNSISYRFQLRWNENDLKYFSWSLLAIIFCFCFLPIFWPIFLCYLHMSKCRVLNYIIYSWNIEAEIVPEWQNTYLCRWISWSFNKRNFSEIKFNVSAFTIAYWSLTILWLALISQLFQQTRRLGYPRAHPLFDIS